MSSRSIPRIDMPSLMLLAPVIAAALACGSDETAPLPPGGGATTPTLSAVRLSAPSSSLTIGATVQITAIALDQSGNPIAATLTWSSSSSDRGTVSSSGTVTGIAPGPTTISVVASAASTNRTQTMTMNVMPPWSGSAPPQNVLVNNAATSSYPDNAQKEPALAVVGQRIVVGYNDESLVFGQTVRGIRNSVGYAYSTDGGATFTDAGEIGSSHWGADPSVTADRNGTFYFGRFDFLSGSTSLDGVAVFRSLDGGKTFTLRSMTRVASIAGVTDKPTIVADNTDGPFSGSVYATWTYAEGVLRVWLSKSSDGGGVFSSPVRLSDGTRDQNSFPAIGPNGELFVLWSDLLAEKLYVRKSLDGGSTFMPAVLVGSYTSIGQSDAETQQYCGPTLNGQLRASGAPILAVDRSGGPMNGRLYVVFNSRGAGTDLSDIFLTWSSNGGQSWSTPLKLNDDATTNDQFMPFVIVAPNGTVAVSWYDRRLDSQNLLMDLFMRLSTDGGATFGPNIKVTDVSSPPPPLNRKLGFPPYTCYMASYNAMGADASHFYVAWTDNRMVTSNVIDPNIRFAKLPY